MKKQNMERLKAILDEKEYGLSEILTASPYDKGKNLGESSILIYSMTFFILVVKNMKLRKPNY